jgi:hypothetical protein
MSDAPVSMVDKVLARFVLLYGEPRTVKIADWLYEYRLALQGFADAVLKAGADAVIARHGVRAWPTIGECVKACREEQVRLPKPETRKLLPWEREDETDWPPPTDEQRQRVNALVRQFKASMLSKGAANG